jgi:tRNA pseudouridine55 synthase
MNYKRHIDGILLLDKPTGVTSNGALQMVKRLFKARKAGHSGSLDPIASGLLPICFGEATKFSRYLLESDKHYILQAQLGVRTDSGDSEGHIIAERSIPSLSLSDIELVLEPFRGEIAQIPSMYSAIKHKGQPLYKLARQGLSVERQPRHITIYRLILLSYENGILSLEVKASKGTYMRTLVDDIGEILGCGAHVVMLRRIGAGPYTADNMIDFSTLEQLEQEGQGNLDALDQYLLPLDSSVATWPDVTLSEAAAYYLRQGQPVIVPYAPTEGWVKLVLKDNSFLGVGEILEDGRVAPRRLVMKGN